MMKRLLGLCLALLLTGCAVDAPQPTTVSTEPTAPATEPVELGLYDPENALEESTNGAVRAYPLDCSSFLGMDQMGDDLVLFLGTTNGTDVVLLSGEKCVERARTSLEFPLSRGSQVTDQGVSCYDEESHTLVFLNRNLQEFRRLELSQDIQGCPVVSPAMDKVFYCSGAEIRVMDLATGISHLLKMQQTENQALTGESLLDGRMITCLVEEPDGSRYLTYVSTEDGETLGRIQESQRLQVCGDLFFYQGYDGIVPEALFGTVDGGTLQSLHTAQSGSGTLVYGGVVTSYETGDGWELSYYDLSSGSRTACVNLGQMNPTGIALAQEGYCWFAGQEGEQWSLYRWEMAKSPVEDDAVCVGPRYTKNAPDAAGLAACQTLADEIGDRHGVDIRVGAAAVEQPCDYVLEPEYQVEAFQITLASLEQALSCYPEGFFGTLCQGMGSGELHIGLVRSIFGDLTDIQYWPDGEVYIALEVGQVEQTFHHALSYVLDAYIIANSLAYDEWEALNPSGFAYDFSYEVYQQRDGGDYLEGENRAFIDSYSMTYPKEDRARILESAMTPGNEDLFTAPVLQAKLRQICLAIRDAFDWKKDPRAFPWEQYLEEPLAYSAS